MRAERSIGTFELTRPLVGDATAHIEVVVQGVSDGQPWVRDPAALLNESALSDAEALVPNNASLAGLRR